MESRNCCGGCFMQQAADVPVQGEFRTSDRIDGKRTTPKRRLVASCCHRYRPPGLIHAPLPPDRINDLPRKFFCCRCHEGCCLAEVFELAERVAMCVEDASAGLA